MRPSIARSGQVASKYSSWSAGKKPAAGYMIAVKLDRLFSDAADALNKTG